MSTLGRAALVVSGGILASRVLGFLREVVLAAFLGRSLEADLYGAAFAIPDYLFFVMAGGYLTITFVPIMSRHLSDGDDEAARRSFTSVAKVVGGLMALLTVVTMVLAQPITELVWQRLPEESLPRLVGLVRIILPAQFFFVVGSLLMAVQYAHRRFLIPTLAPLIYNAAIITGGLIGWSTGNVGPESFVWGALIGAVVGNFALQWWGAARLGLRWASSAPARAPVVKEYFGLALPLMIGQSAVALDEVFLRVFGQLGGSGDLIGLQYARRINMVPVGVIAQAAGVASYPFIARLFAEGAIDELRATVGKAMRLSLVVAGLGAAAVFSLAEPVTRLAYQRGSFGPDDTTIVAGLLAIFAFSIPMWAAHQVYTRGFYAQRRMWLPVGVGTALTILAVPLYLMGADRFGVAGIAWASVTVMALYAVVIGLWWHRDAPASDVLRVAGQVLLATLAAGWAGTWPAGIDQPLIALLAGGTVVAAVYISVLAVMRAPELKELMRRS